MTAHSKFIFFFPKQEAKICPEVVALSGSLNPYIGTDNEVIDGDEQAFLQAILEDDNRIKAQSKVNTLPLKSNNEKDRNIL